MKSYSLAVQGKKLRVSITIRYLLVKWLCVLVLTLTLVSNAFSAPQPYNLLDYKGPSTVGTTWLYSGAISTRVQVVSVQQKITSHTGGVTATPYFTNVVNIRYDYGIANHDGSFTSEDEWHEYITTKDGYRLWGDDDDGESLRIDGGLNFGTFLAIGETKSSSAQIYDNATYIGVVNGSVALLDVADVTVPAGTFANCLHLRITLTVGDEIQSWDEWWAAGVGVVKTQGVSGVGVGKTRALEWYNFSVTPAKSPQSNTSVVFLLLQNK